MIKNTSFIAVAILGISLLGAPTLQAQASLSAERIQILMQQIASLQAQLLALQGQSTGSPTTTPLGPERFTFDLKEGMTHSDVRTLQQLLGTDREIYSDGRVTGFFGPLTREALTKFQTRFGISGEAGFAGPGTRAYLNALFREENLGHSIPPGLLTRTGLVERIQERLSGRERDEDDDDRDDEYSDDIESIEIELRERTARIKVEFEDGREDSFVLELRDRRDIIEELADRYDMDIDDVEDLVDVRDVSEIRRIDVVIYEDDDEAEVTVYYEDRDTREEEFTHDETRENRLIEDIADEFNVSEEEVEDVVRFEYEDDEDDLEIEEIYVRIYEDDDYSRVTVEYENGDRDRFKLEEVREDRLIEDIADELDIDEEDVEDLVEFDYRD